jgi:translation initiation factor 5
LFIIMASSSINIGGGEDAYNRYKMPPVVGKVEGKGNGIKTRIDNCFEVARALHRPPGYVCKFFGCELGALTKIDDETRLYIVNGAFEDRVLADTLKKFIQMFVMCAKCNLPETDIKVKKNGDIIQICNACGTTSLCDMSHKLCTYIVNNPPNGKKKSAGSGKVSKAERRAKKAKAAATGGGEAADLDEKSMEEKARRRAARAAAKAADEAAANGGSVAALSNGNGTASKSKNASAAALATVPAPAAISGVQEDMADAVDKNGKDEDDDDDDVEWSVDMSKEAEEARRRDMGAAAAILERTSIVDDAALAEKLRAYIDDGKKPSKVASKASKIFDGDENVVRAVIAAALVGETTATAEDAIKKTAAPILGANFGVPMNAKAHAQFFAYFDYVTAKDVEALKMLPFVLKAAYDAELVEEEAICKWHKSAAGRADVKEAVHVIVEWLENASEEEDEADDDDADDE